MDRHEIKVGSYIKKDGKDFGERLLPCDDWDKADFRWPNPIPEWRTKHAIACNVEVTGRVYRWIDGKAWMRVKFTWVGDGTQNIVTRGMVLVESDADRDRNAEEWNCFGCRF